MKIAVVGAGRMGRIHVSNLHDASQVTELVVHDTDASTAQAVAASFEGAEYRPDALEAIRRGYFDGVVIATSTAAHAELVRLTVEVGTPSFVEKPLTPDIDSCESLTELVATRNVPVQVGYQRRFDPEYQDLKRVVDSGGVGRITSIVSCTRDPAPPSRAYLNTSGGIHFDCAIHDLDSANWIVGAEPVEVVAFGRRDSALYDGLDDFETVNVMLHYEAGVTASIHATRYNAAGYDARLEVYGERDSLTAGLGPRTPVGRAGRSDAANRGQSHQGFIDRFAVAYAAEIEAFLTVVASGGQPLCTPLDSLRAQRVAGACDRSVRRGGSAVEAVG